jgi:hypothetical protein
VVPAAWVAGFVLVLAGCTQQNQTATNSPEVTPSAVTTPSSQPTPSDSPSPATSPTAAASPSPAKLIIRTVPFHIGEVGLNYGTVTLVAAGGVKPYKWSISAGALPGGVVLSSKGIATGKPTGPGTFSFVVRVDDAAGGAAGVPTSIFVFRQIAFTKATASCLGTYLTGCTTTLDYVGGASTTSPKVNFTLSAGAPPLPAGSTITAKGGVVTVSVAIPACSYPLAVLTLILVDPKCSAGYLCSSSPAKVDVNLSSGC